MMWTKGVHSCSETTGMRPLGGTVLVHFRACGPGTIVIADDLMCVKAEMGLNCAMSRLKLAMTTYHSVGRRHCERSSFHAHCFDVRFGKVGDGQPSNSRQFVTRAKHFSNSCKQWPVP